MNLSKSPKTEELDRIRQNLARLDPVGVAEELARLERPARAMVFRLLSTDLARRTFRYLDPAHQEDLLAGLSDERAVRLVEDMDPDDRARLFGDLPAEVARRLLADLSPDQRRFTSVLLGYPEESAGRIMTPQFVQLEPGMTVGEALERYRRRSAEIETHYALPVTGERNRLVGTVEIRDLLLAAPESRVEEVMDREPRSVTVDEDQESVARLVQAADLLAVPVVDGEGGVVGMITVDDAMDVLTLEESEDLARVGASEPLGRPYFSVSIFRLARRRMVWLLLLVVASTLTVHVLDAFEDSLQAAVGLALFIPLLIGTGGNAGAQSSTTIVRGMAVGEVRVRDLLRTALRETVVGLLLGVMLGALGVAPVWLFAGRSMALVIALSLVTICTLASLVGAVMPILARAADVDPAVVSAPFVTTVVDASGLLVYFLIARAVLNL
jgi:magnesium transporter